MNTRRPPAWPARLSLWLQLVRRPSTPGIEALPAMKTFWNKSNLIFHARAKAFHAAGRLDPALRDLTEAVRVAPQNRELHKILLSLKLEMKDKARVRDHAKDSRDSSSGVCSSGEGSTRDEDHDNETSL